MKWTDKLLLETTAIPYFLYTLGGGCILALLYRLNFINTYLYVFTIAAAIPIYFIKVHYFTKDDILTKWLHLPSFILLLVVLLIEAPILLFEERDQSVNMYLEPFEIIEGTNIYGVAVRSIAVEDSLAQQVNIGDKTPYGTIISIVPYTNLEKISDRSYWLKERLKLGQTDLEDSVANATAVLEEEVEEVKEYATKNLRGNSVGLALTLSGKLQQQETENAIPVVLTGAINPDGAVYPVGMVPEKLRIAEMAGFKYAIVPEDNMKLAEEAKRKYKLQLDIKAVNHYEEALQYVQQLNQ